MLRATWRTVPRAPKVDEIRLNNSLMAELSVRRSPPRGGGALTRGLAIEGYDILEPLGHGAQGVVYEAVHRATKRRVLKVLIGGRFATPRQRGRLDGRMRPLPGCDTQTSFRSSTAGRLPTAGRFAQSSSSRAPLNHFVADLVTTTGRRPPVHDCAWALPQGVRRG